MGANVAKLRRELHCGVVGARSAPPAVHSEVADDVPRKKIQNEKISCTGLRIQRGLPNARLVIIFLHCGFLLFQNLICIMKCSGVVVRSIWIAPEKALKMAGWDAGVNFVNYAYPQCPKGLQWLFGGAMAGAGTTIIGEFKY